LGLSDTISLWRKTGIFTYEALLCFALLVALFLPFSFHYLSFQSKLTAFLFEDIVLALAEQLKCFAVVNPTFSSDSSTSYLLVFLLLVVAFLLRTIIIFWNKWTTYRNTFVAVSQLLLTYYLAAIMLIYGFSKIVKAQFYLPEPNTLFTPLGMLDKDILFWGTMGTSHAYSVFMGCMEVIPALLLLYRKTRVLGLCILTGVLSQVVAVNLSFDISVKLFSTFLLLINLLLLAPTLKQLSRFFLFYQSATLSLIPTKRLIPSKAIRHSLKACIILFFFAEALLPYIKTGHYNDDIIPRHPLHGAYAVTHITSIHDSTSIPELEIKRFFIHRQSYFIFQYADDRMEDFTLHIDSMAHRLTLTPYKSQQILLAYRFDKASGKMEIQSDALGVVIHGQAIAWRALPLMQPLFHWTVDEVGLEMP